MTGDDGDRRDGPHPAGTEGDLAQRLERLRAQVERKDRKRSADAARGPSGGVSPMGQAMRLSSEFIGGVVAGGAIGWAFDALLGTRPWGLMVFLLLGFATGIYNVMRVSGFVARPTVPTDKPGRENPKNGPEGP